MRFPVVVAIVIAGCDLPLPAVQARSGDAGTSMEQPSPSPSSSSDGGPSFCGGHPSAIVCDDFTGGLRAGTWTKLETQGALSFSDGVMHATASGGDSQAAIVPVSVSRSETHKLSVDFRLDSPVASIKTADILSIVFNATSGATVNVGLVSEDDGDYFRIVAVDDSIKKNHPTKVETGKWYRVTLTLDTSVAASPSASLTITADGNTKAVSEALKEPSGTEIELRVGLKDVPAPGLTVSYDNALLTVESD